MKKTLFIAFMVILLPGLIRPAYADYPWGFVQITCVPELSYFSIQRFTIMNIPHFGPYLTDGITPNEKVQSELMAIHGIYNSSSYLKDHPFVCNIPAVSPKEDSKFSKEFRVEVTGKYDSPPDVSNYSHMQDEINVILNGKQIGKMGLNPYGLGVDDDTISIAPDGQSLVVSICSILESGDNDSNKKELSCVDNYVKN